MALAPKPILYQGKPDDKLITVDVYTNKVDKAPANLLTKLSKSVEDGVFKALTLGDKDVNSLRDSVNWGVRNLDKFKSKDFAKTLLTTAFPNAKGALNGLKSELLGTLAGSLGLNAQSSLELYRAVKDGNYNDTLGKVAGNNPLVKLYLDGNTIVKAVEDADSVSDFVGLANSMLDGGVAKVFNLTSQGAALGTLVDTAMKLQLPELADHVIALAGDDVAKDLLKKAMISSAVSGSVLSMFNFLGRVDIPDILLDAPNLISQCMKAYKHMDDTGANSSTLTMLKAVLNRTNPDWNGAITGKPDISVWANINMAGIELASLEPRTMMLALSGLNYKAESVSESIAHTMPWVNLPETSDPNDFVIY